MIVAIHQPHYLPWLGYFYKMASCDTFVLLDNVGYSKNGFINRNRIKTPQGPTWLTVGVLTRNHFGQPINKVEINNTVPWNNTHYKSLSHNYARAPYFLEYKTCFEDVYRQKWERLADLNEALIKVISILLGMNIKYIRASKLNVPGHRTELLVNICKALGANTYLSGPMGREYMDEELFKKEGLSVRYSDFKHPAYKQLWGDFIPNMSIVDLMFNKGQESLGILTGGS